MSGSVGARLGRLVPWLLLVGACVGELLTVRVEQGGSTFIQGGGVLGGVLSALELGGFDDLSVNVDQELANQGVSPGDIASVYVVELSLSTPDGEDLAFVDTLDIFVSAPGLETARIAHLDDFPAGVTSLEMELDGVDLTDYVVAESMTITTEAAGTLPENDTTIDVFMAIDVEATAAGACSQVQKQQAAAE